MIVHLSATELLVGLTVLFVAVWVWRASVRRARRIATAARNSARLASLAGRVVCTAAMFGAVQWVLVTHPGYPGLLVAVLAVPDVLAGYVLARALTVTTVEEPQHRGGGRR